MKKTVFTALENKIEGKVHHSKHFREFYSVDASSYQITPKIIVIPKNDEDVINTIKIAKKFKIGVTPRGGGTGLVGSALNHGIILDILIQLIPIMIIYITIIINNPIPIRHIPQVPSYP